MKFRTIAAAALLLTGSLDLADAALLRQNADGSIGIVSEATGIEALRAGGQKSIGLPGAGASVASFHPGEVIKIGPFAGVAATTGGAIGAWTNNLGYNIVCDSATFDVTTASTGAANLTVGQTPTGVTTSSSNLIGATSVASISVIASAAIGIKIKSGEFVTLQGSADTTGLVGSLYMRCFPL